MLQVLTKHVIGGHALGGTYQLKHFGGAKALFSYANLQISDAIGGGSKIIQNFSFGALLPVPPCRYVPGPNQAMHFLFPR